MGRPMFIFLFVITQCWCFLKVATGQTCSAYCMTCDNGVCKRCQESAYLSSTTGECLFCSISNCKTCIGDGSCESCYEGYYGDRCLRCPSKDCVNNTCDMKSGICSYGCKVGYFQNDTFCYKCDTYCKSCNSSTQCLECMPGYYGSMCQYGCQLCKGGECSIEGCTDGCRDRYFVKQAGTPCEPCNNNCTSCSSYTECSLCKDGFYGQACQLPCQSCTPCSKINGSCLTTTPGADLTSQSTQPFDTPTASKVMTIKPTTSAPSSTSTTSKIYLGVGILVVLVIAAIVVVVVIRRRNKKGRSHRLQASRASHGQTGMLMTENVAYVSADECLSDRPVVGIGGNNRSDIMTPDAVYSMSTKTSHVPNASQE